MDFSKISLKGVGIYQPVKMIDIVVRVDIYDGEEVDAIFAD